MEGTQSIFQIVRLSSASRLSHLLCTVPPSIPYLAAVNYDALVEEALSSIIGDDGDAASGLPTPEHVAHNTTMCHNQTYLGHGALRQANLPIREGAVGLTSSNSVKGAAYIGCHALVLGCVIAASPGQAFHPFSNGCLSDPWRQRSLKSGRPWPPRSSEVKSWMEWTVRWQPWR